MNSDKLPSLAVSKPLKNKKVSTIEIAQTERAKMTISDPRAQTIEQTQNIVTDGDYGWTAFLDI